MGWSYEIGKVFGIRVKVHGIFLLLLAGIGLSELLRGDVVGAVGSVLFVCTIFAFVFLHELGHSLMAIRHGVRVYDITLLPIGGVARLADIPEEPNTELKIAAAGPLVNIAIALVLLPVFILLAAGGVFFSSALTLAAIIGNLFMVNVMLAAFNFIPAFPMDGGRILRALLAKRWHYVTASEMACRVGKVIAGAFIALGILALFVSIPFVHPILLPLIGAFIWSAGGREVAAVKARHLQGQAGSAPFGQTHVWPNDADPQTPPPGRRPRDPFQELRRVFDRWFRGR